MDLVNLVPIWASPSPGDFVPHLDLIAVDSLSDLVTLFPTGINGTWLLCSPPVPHLDMITLLRTLASTGPDDSGPPT